MQRTRVIHGMHSHGYRVVIHRDVRLKAQRLLDALTAAAATGKPDNHQPIFHIRAEINDLFLARPGMRRFLDFLRADAVEEHLINFLQDALLFFAAQCVNR